ncbi:hypothetical protein KAW80_01565 [Candidatus Babeliales bacterium]|nr:hypothetical protein [Candidatus Babeliales bacterium]
MKQELWQLNSSMLVIFFLILSTSIIIKQTIPSLRLPKQLLLEIPTEEHKDIKIEDIYTNDLFETYVPTTAEEKQLINPIPEPRSHEALPLPAKLPVTLLPPLDIKLKGILFSSESMKNIALLEDETGKEQSYAVGEKIKDAQIAKIVPEKVIIFRNNGQQEIIYLKEKDEQIEGINEVNWSNTVNKVDDFEFTIDPSRFKTMVSSLGQLFEDLNLITAYKDDIPYGIRIGKLKEKTVGLVLGLREKDVITEVNNTKVIELKDRYQTLKSIVNTQINDEIIIKILRDKKNINLSYKLANLPLIKKSAFEKLRAQKAGLFKLNRDQERSENVRSFDRKHPINRQQILEEIRKRILENIKTKQIR